MKRENTGIVKLYASRGLPKIDGKVDLIIKWYRKNKRSDPDNIAGGIKFILDGIVESGKLENDGWKQINSIKHEFEVDNMSPRVDITFIRVEG